MGRLSAQFKSDIQQPIVNLGLFAEFEFDSGTERFWTGESSISWNSQTWQGGGLIGGVSIDGEADNLAARRLVFTLNNVDRAYYAIAVNTPYRNRPARLWINTLNSLGTSVSGSHLVEEGRMDTMEIGKDGTLRLTVESRLLDLFKPNRYRMTNSDHQRLSDPDQIRNYSTDKFYEYVPFMPSAELPWGLETKANTGGAGGGGATGGGRPPLFTTGR